MKSLSDVSIKVYRDKEIEQNMINEVLNFSHIYVYATPFKTNKDNGIS